MPRYRRPCLTARAAKLLQDEFRSVCADFGCQLQDFAHERDHVRLLVAYRPKVALSKLVGALKGVSARRLRAARLPELQHALVGNAFWSPSYFAVSCGDAPLEKIQRYVHRRHSPS
jgi:putative transposase